MARVSDMDTQSPPRRRISVQQVVAHDRLLAVGADADDGHAAARELLERGHVLLSVDRQVLEGAGAGDVLGPTVEVLEDRLRVVELGLRLRHLVLTVPVDLVGHADGDPLDAGDHVEFGQHIVGEAVDPRALAGWPPACDSGGPSWRCPPTPEATQPGSRAMPVSTSSLVSTASVKPVPREA